MGKLLCKKIKIFSNFAFKQKKVEKIKPSLRKISDNYYLLVRKNPEWSDEEKYIIKQNLNYKLFNNIPKNYIDNTIYGEMKAPPKYIMFNFDSKNGIKQSIRGITVVSVEDDYFTISLIGNISVRNTVSSAVKTRHNIQTKSGKDMLEWWKKFGDKSHFKYCKLYAMEDVLGFYWKYGWRFNRHRTGREYIINERINKINKINKYLVNKNTSEYSEERDYMLRKYFDRYMEGYYNDKELLNTSVTKIKFYYDIKNTTVMKRFNMRDYGYPMYYNCENNTNIK
jgi:hypothetical protein